MMLFRKKHKRKTKKALKDSTLQKALEKASSQHFHKYHQTKQEVSWEEFKDKAKAIRDECLQKLPQLIQKFTDQAQKSGSQVHLASTPEEALSSIEKILEEKKAQLIVKSKSMVSEEIHLNPYLQKKGYRVVETDLGERIIQLAKEKPSHITAPALHKTKEEIARLFSRHFHKEIPPDSREIVKQVREEMRGVFVKADVGISGANFAVAESGTLVIISNEGNARLVTSLPPVHIALVTTEKMVENLEQTTALIKALILASSGEKMTSYVSYITGPSRTTDIEKESVTGVHGPQEVHIIILDNGRLNMNQDKDLRSTLRCLKCGGCMLVCPVFQSLGGHVYGGSVYPGGIGTLLTAMTQSLEKSAHLLDFCADCKKCEEFCPVRIPTGDLILQLKNRKGSRVWEKTLSRLFAKKNLFDWGSRILSILQKPLEKNGYLKSLPFPWTRKKSLPALNFKKPPPSKQKNQKKIFLFQGCLVKQFFPEIRDGVFTTYAHLGYEVVSPSQQSCCGAPSLHLGQREDVQRLARENLEQIEKENPDYILTVCPTGEALLKNTYPEILPEFSSWAPQIFDFSRFLIEKGHLSSLPPLSSKQIIFYHYPCHSRIELKSNKDPLRILRELGFIPVEEEEPYTCCGFCGVFSFKNPEISDKIWEKKRKRILHSGSRMIATDCPGCLLQIKSCLRNESDSFQVFHTAELVAEAFRSLHKQPGQRI